MSRLCVWCVSLIADRRLAGGAYTITASQADRSGRTDPPILLDLFGEPVGTVIVDTTAPRVMGLTFDPSSRHVTVTFQDQGFGAETPYMDASVFRVTRPSAREGLGISGTTSSYEFGTEPLTVRFTILDDRPLPAGGYRLSIDSAMVTDHAGNALDGEFRGALPSGDGRPGGDFRAVLAAGPAFRTSGRRR